MRKNQSADSRIKNSFSDLDHDGDHPEHNHSGRSELSNPLLPHRLWYFRYYNTLFITLILAGFAHSAFAVKSEAQLDRSVHFRKHIPRGELVELLSKALQYIEVESHWNGSSLALNCKSPFSLLEAHTCSLDPNAKVPVLKIPLERPKELMSSRSKVAPAASPKRKAISPPGDIGTKEKRSRLSADDRMDIDSNSTQRQFLPI